MEKEKASSFLIPSPLSIWPASPFSRRPASLLLFPLFPLPSWASPLGRAGHCSAPAQQACRPSTAATAAAPSLCQPSPAVRAAPNLRPPRAQSGRNRRCRNHPALAPRVVGAPSPLLSSTKASRDPAALPTVPFFLSCRPCPR